MSDLRRPCPFPGALFLLVVGLAASLSAGPRPSPSPTPSPSPSPSPKAGKPAPVYTEEDLKKAGGHVNKLEASPGAGRSESEGGQTSEGNEEQDREREWRERFAARRQEIASVEAKVKELEAKLAALNLDADPNAPDLMDPNRLQKREAAIQAATADLEKAREEVARLRRELSALEDEARRAHVPPGWTRE